MNPLIQLKKAILVFFIALGLACFAFSRGAQAVSPAPDGGYAGGNTAEGTNALFSLTSGTNNTAAGGQALYHDTSGSNDTATGLRALFGNTTGVNNTATGSQALLSNTTGSSNTANGYVALSSNTSGTSNTAVGSGALHSNTVGSQNTATGYIALYHNTTGTQNTAAGDRALYSNINGAANTADGYQALDNNTVGNSNTAVGTRALASNTTSSWNVAIGNGSLSFTNGAFDDANTAVGYGALGALGNFLNATGSHNIALGYGAGGDLIEGNNNIYVGNSGPTNFPGQEDNTMRIGDAQTITFIAGISGATVSGGAPVYVNSSGQLGTNPSSARFKKDIQSMDKASAAILALKPVTFHYKSDKRDTPQFGLIAEEVAAVNPDLVVGDDKGEIYTVRYDAVNAMLLNEFLKEHRKVQELTKDFQATVAQLTARLDEQATQIQKVSAQLATARPSAGGLEAKPAPQVVNNP
jgi:hypothetical protein